MILHVFIQRKVRVLLVLMYKNLEVRNKTMLKATATWQEIQAAWDGLTNEQRIATAQKFDKGLKQHDPATHARLIAMFENEETIGSLYND